jgi:transcriptional regulator with XRE-family HTH domain
MSKPIYDSFDLGRVLRECRKASGLTQRDAARLTGVSPRLWSECEQGKRARVGFENVLRMLQTMGADLEARPRGTMAQATGGQA